MNKAIRTSIDRKYPMHWEMDPDSVAGRMRLIATTAIYENGNVRTRVLCRTYSTAYARQLSDEITAQGGKLVGSNPDDLHARWQERQKEHEWEARCRR